MCACECVCLWPFSRCTYIVLRVPCCSLSVRLIPQSTTGEWAGSWNATTVSRSCVWPLCGCECVYARIRMCARVCAFFISTQCTHLFRAPLLFKHRRAQLIKSSTHVWLCCAVWGCICVAFCVISVVGGAKQPWRKLSGQIGLAPAPWHSVQTPIHFRASC